MGNQNGYLKDLCIVVPILKYEIRTRKGKKRIVNTVGDKECVSFTARTRDIMVEAQWLSGDDMDLSVREPDGDVVSYNRVETECGLLYSDASVDSCGVDPTGNERIGYDRGCGKFEKGEYVAFLKHTENCDKGATFWSMRVVIDGRVVKRLSGTSNRNGGAVVGMIKFTV